MRSIAAVAGEGVRQKEATRQAEAYHKLRCFSTQQFYISTAEGCVGCFEAHFGLFLCCSERQCWDDDLPLAGVSWTCNLLTGLIGSSSTEQLLTASAWGRCQYQGGSCLSTSPFVTGAR